MAVLLPEIAVLAEEGAAAAAPWIAEVAAPAVADAVAGGGILRNMGAGMQWIGRGFKGAPAAAAKAPKAGLGARLKTGIKNTAKQAPGVALGSEISHQVDKGVDWATGTTNVGSDTLRQQGGAENRVATFYTGAGH
jgi:hypothetical protein